LFREGIRRFSFARLRSSVALAVDVAVCVVQLGSLLALWNLGRLTVPSAFVVMGLASGLAGCGWLLSRPGWPLVARDNLRVHWRENWAFSRWTVLSYLTVDTIPFLMPWLIGFAAGAAATGLYGGCATLVGVTNILVHGAGNYMRPKAAHAFAADGVAALRNVLLLTGGVFVTVFGLLCLGFLATGDLLAVFVFGPEFRGTGWLLTLLAANVVVGSLGYVAGSGLWALGQPRASMMADACMLVATLVSAFLLIGPYGPVGAALAALIGTTIGTALKILTVHWEMESHQSRARQSNVS
jgi:O-antigen/teichoic acid export membrane protein